MNKEGFLYKGMAKYRFKLLTVNLILLLLFIIYTINILPYLKTSFTGPKALDTERFLKETSAITIDKPIELGRKDHKLPDMSLVKDNTYWQGDVYDFVIDTPSLKPVGETFKGVNNITGKETEMYKVYMTELGGRKAAVLAYPEEITDKKITANLSQMQKPIASVISKSLEDSETIELSEYVIDLRGAEMGAEDSDVLFFWLSGVLLAFLFIKLIVYYVYPKSAPTFRQLAKYGDMDEVIKDVDSQSKLDTVYKDGNMLVFNDYIITKSTFKLVVNKNHMSKN